MLGYPVTPELAQAIKDKRFGVIFGAWCVPRCELGNWGGLHRSCSCSNLQSVACMQVPGEHASKQPDEHRSIRGVL